MIEACNRAWYPTLFEVLGTILVFNLGLPAFVLQVLIPEELRQVLFRHWRLIGRPLIVTGTFSVLVALFTLLGALDTEPPAWHLNTTIFCTALLMVWTSGYWFFLSRNPPSQYLIERLGSRLRHDIVHGGTIHPEPEGLRDLFQVARLTGRHDPQDRFFSELGQILACVLEDKRYKGRSLEEFTHFLGEFCVEIVGEGRQHLDRKSRLQVGAVAEMLLSIVTRPYRLAYLKADDERQDLEDAATVAAEVALTLLQTAPSSSFDQLAHVSAFNLRSICRLAEEAVVQKLEGARLVTLRKLESCLTEERYQSKGDHAYLILYLARCKKESAWEAHRRSESLAEWARARGSDLRSLTSAEVLARADERSPKLQREVKFVLNHLRSLARSPQSPDQAP
ncbi:MAG TPA: hypothetical protein VF017_23330 [Thermoanaerobaculia bacterium]|nr:hypothetical protein [Thermoanaerobaculia bacterium]